MRQQHPRSLIEQRSRHAVATAGYPDAPAFARLVEHRRQSQRWPDRIVTDDGQQLTARLKQPLNNLGQLRHAFVEFTDACDELARTLDLPHPSVRNEVE